ARTDCMPLDSAGTSRHTRTGRGSAPAELRPATDERRHPTDLVAACVDWRARLGDANRRETFTRACTAQQNAAPSECERGATLVARTLRQDCNHEPPRRERGDRRSGKPLLS